MASYRILLGCRRSPSFFATSIARRMFATALPVVAYQIPRSPWLPFDVFLTSISRNVGSTWTDLWESILRAVPKKKTSHSKKRSRFLAGKALKDVTSLNRCSGCGNVKRAHLLCPYCVKGITLKGSPSMTRLMNCIEIRDMWRKQGEKAEVVMKT